MKKLLISALSLGICARAFAIFGVGDIVHDPIMDANLVTMNSTQLAQWATAIKKYEEQIRNQIQQIDNLKKLGDINSLLNAKVGDWKGVYDQARSIQLSADNLTRNWTVGYDQAVSIDNGQSSIYYTGNGSYVALDITTKNGQPAATVKEKDLRRYVTVENLYDNLNDTLKKTEVARTDLLKEIATTSEQIAKASTQAETAKLNAKLDGLKVALANVQAQRNEVMYRLLVQQAMNQSEQQKETDVRAAVDAANANQSLEAIGNTSFGGKTF